MRVSKSSIVPSENGLFVTNTINENSVVAKMVSPTLCSLKEVQERGHAHDTGVHVSPRKFLWDAAFKGKRKPKWYYINHSSKNPNVKMKLINAPVLNVHWVALRKLEKGEELTYDYGCAPKHWG